MRPPGHPGPPGPPGRPGPPGLPDPTPLLQALSGVDVNAAVIAALELRVCAHLVEGKCTARELASRASISERGAQAILDALVALGACTVEGGVYANGPLGEAFMVPGRPMYLGDEEAAQFRHMLPAWGRLADIARAGQSEHDAASDEMIEWWTKLTPAIARRQRPFAEEAVRWLGLTEGEPSLLDVGGGAALYGLALLRQNPKARATQIDWPQVNRVAVEEVGRAGVADRFAVIDGDFRTAALGGPYDVAVLSNVVNQEAPPDALALMTRVRAALRPGGRLLVSEPIVDDGRAAPRPPLLFNLKMLLSTRGGRSYARSEIVSMFRDAGFAEPTFRGIGPMSTFAVAATATT